MECNISSCSKWRAHFRTLRPPCLCFIIPEYMNKEIVEKGSKIQKARAWKNLVLTEQLRGRRQVTGLMSSMFAVSDKLYRTIMTHIIMKICRVLLSG